MNNKPDVPAAPLPFIDLAAQRKRLGKSVDEAILRVLDHGQYIMGPEVAALENELAKFCGAKHVLSCGNGTMAIELILRAKGVGPGDAVLCPSFTFAATAEVVALVGGTPVFVDVLADTFNLDPNHLDAGIAAARQANLKPVGIIAVDLFGQPADYEAIEAFCRAKNLWLLDDAAQSFGAHYRGRAVGTIGLATATSFFPAKPLGCYGDGGAIFTDDPGLADILRSLRIHGQGSDKYDAERIGQNGRLDSIQAAVLLEKLKIFSDEISRRDAVAKRYNDGLKSVAEVPDLAPNCTSVWAQYTIKVPAAKRSTLANALRSQGIPTAIYYPKPLHRQIAYRGFPAAGNGLPVTDAIAQQVISLPMHPYLDAPTQDRIIDAVVAALR
ncbi:MAG: DegT/DnrJ/EryC1/StrS family aminotransferase [Pseudolabrys sp.]|nr:DegT/DnrJ/EryC1/StrS family aminotransferase [Pseudolabrys sp.]